MVRAKGVVGMKRWSVPLFVAVLLCALLRPALSDDRIVEDREGDGSGSVDLVRASHAHGSATSGPGFGEEFGGSVIVHDIQSADEWTFDGDVIEVRMTSRRWDVARRLFVHSNPDGSLTGVVFRRDTFRGYANVYTPDATTLRIEFPESILGEDVRAYQWRVFGTGAGGAGCGEGVDCSLPPPDRLPDEGSVQHRGLWRYNP